MKDTVIGLDLAKNVFHFVAIDKSGHEHSKKKLTRKGLIKHFAKIEPSKIAMESCSGAHYWAKQFQALGHEVELLPPQHVKAYLRGQKNDYNDARAIAEAAQHGAIRPVKVKTTEQLDNQAFHRIRRELSTTQIRLSNKIRGLLNEHGIVLAQGLASFRKGIPQIVEDAENGLSAKFRELLSRQYSRFIDLDEELKWYNKQLEREAKTNETQRRLIEVPGLGPVNSSALMNWMGDGKQFRRGRDASAALGVIPRQHTSGDKHRLQGISKRGDSYVRSLVIHGARAVVSHAKKKTDTLSQWINSLVERRGFNKAVVALANKLIRTAWVIISRGEEYKPRVI